MSKSFYYDVNENKWKSVRGHNCPGAVWVDDATEDEIRAHLTKIPEIIKAQAEIAALRAENIRLLVRCDEKFDIIDNKDKLIAQMRKAQTSIYADFKDVCKKCLLNNSYPGDHLCLKCLTKSAVAKLEAAIKAAERGE